MEDAGASPRGVEHGGAVEEVAPEEADAAFVAPGERKEVVRLGLVICVTPTKSTVGDLRRPPHTTARSYSTEKVGDGRRNNGQWH